MPRPDVFMLHIDSGLVSGPPAAPRCYGSHSSVAAAQAPSPPCADRGSRGTAEGHDIVTKRHPSSVIERMQTHTRAHAAQWQYAAAWGTALIIGAAAACCAASCSAASSAALAAASRAAASCASSAWFCNHETSPRMWQSSSTWGVVRSDSPESGGGGARLARHSTTKEMGSPHRLDL